MPCLGVRRALSRRLPRLALPALAAIALLTTAAPASAAPPALAAAVAAAANVSVRTETVEVDKEYATQPRRFTVDCGPDEEVLSGGYSAPDPAIRVVFSYPSDPDHGDIRCAERLLDRCVGLSTPSRRAVADQRKGPPSRRALRGWSCDGRRADGHRWLGREPSCAVAPWSWILTRVRGETHAVQTDATNVRHRGISVNSSPRCSGSWCWSVAPSRPSIRSDTQLVQLVR
jgi:hypothetical protein